MSKLKLLVILFIVLIFTLSLGVTYSLFTTDVSLVSNNKVAKFVFEAKELDGFELPIKSMLPGETQNYNFSVTNSKKQVQSDVNIEYQITIKTFHFMPLEIKLFDKDDNLVLNCDESYARNEDNELVCNTDYKLLSYDKTMTEEYNLRISFPEKYNTLDYANLIDFISLSINSYQKVGDSK